MWYSSHKLTPFTSLWKGKPRVKEAQMSTNLLAESISKSCEGVLKMVRGPAWRLAQRELQDSCRRVGKGICFLA